ncbi:MAG: Ig-like domain-containing protein, partial [Promethearchaeia archaeon]
TSLIWVYLSENSTGKYNNRSMISANGNYTYTLDISALEWDDELMFSFYANDSAGNIKWKNNEGSNYTLKIHDFQAPVTRISYNLSDTPPFVNGTTEFSLSAEDNFTQGGSGIGNIAYRIESGDWKIYENPFNLSEFTEGNHTIYFNATDLAGNTEESRSCTLYLDINNITSSIIYDPFVKSNVKYVNETQHFSFDWDDGSGSGLKNLYYRVDSEPYSKYSGEFNLNGYTEGSHNISFYTIDNVGNQEPVKNTEIYLDLEAPDVSLDYQVIKEPNYIFETDTIQIKAGADAGSGINVSQYRIEDEPWKNQVEFSLDDLTSGNYTIYYRVKDNVGNVREKEQWVYLVTSQSDLDNDGLTFSDEYKYGTDPFNPDTDGDKLLDGEEIHEFGTNPLKKDTDGDGYSDYAEIYEFETDPNNPFSSPTARVIIIIGIIGAISVSGYIGIKKWKIHKRAKTEKKTTKMISDRKSKVLFPKKLDQNLKKANSNLSFSKIAKKRRIEGKLFREGKIFIKEDLIEHLNKQLLKIGKELFNQKSSSLNESDPLSMKDIHFLNLLEEKLDRKNRNKQNEHK